ncbi:hypothetical protein KKE19_04075 [Patescibacteria group bacterium]|nr:hypothetical protein [Patescibacteria group bacterium]MBU4578673.1 hypothetical protein [Patescibacteria group bacterium]
MSNLQHKKILITQAKEIYTMLDEYLTIHNKVIKSTGTVTSLFKDHDYLAMYNEIDKVKTSFDNKVLELKEIKGKYYASFTGVSADFFDALDGYFNALYEAVREFHLFITRLYETSKGIINNKQKLSWLEYSQLTKAYDKKVKAYQELGSKLNEMYQKLEGEKTNYIDEKNIETKMLDELEKIKLIKIKINSFERYPILYTCLVLLCLFITLAVLLNGFLSIMFWIVTVIVGFFTFSIMYVRLSTKWRRIHYPLMVRYASALGFAQGQDESITIDEKMDFALLFLLQSVYPTISPDILKSYYSSLLEEFPLFMGYEMLCIVLKKKLSSASTEDIEKLAKHFTDKVKNEKFKKVWLVMSNLIKIKYGEEEKFEYLFSIINGKAT